MNVERHLILAKGQDKTEEIKKCIYDKGKWQVTFNDNKVWSYGYNNIKWLKDPIIINHENYFVYDNDQPLTGIGKILDFGDYYRIIYKSGYKKIFPRRSIVLKERGLKTKSGQDLLEYLHKLADKVSMKNEEDDYSFLSNQFSKLTINPRSVLANYIENKPINKKDNLKQPIFPFGFNLSQKSATEKAITEQISVIEGPPGTGKIQTILNIIANAIVNKETVAIVSNNNSATANVLEKLQKYDVDFIAAYLGNNDNKEKFFAEQKQNYPSMSNWELSHSEILEIKANLKEAQKKLNEMLELQNKRAVLKLELSGLLTESEYFDKYYTESSVEPLTLAGFSRPSADKILTVLIDYQRNIEKEKHTLITKLYNLIFYGIYSFKFYKNPPELIVSFLQKNYYDKKIKEIKNKIKDISSELQDYNFDNEMEKYSQNSMKLFKAQLAKRCTANGNRRKFTNDIIRKNFQDFIKEYPVILSTTHSLRSCASENYLFDYVIIDEASQVDLVTGALALSCAKNAVIVGDVKQLPNVVPSEVEKASRDLFESYKLNSAYSYADNSLLSSIITLYKDIPKTLLKEHYRCHPKIIGFCNQKFYNNELVILTNEQDDDKPLKVYKTVKGNHARGNFNQRQIDVVFDEIIPNQGINESLQSIGIISPYRLQTDELKKVIGDRNIEADTVHKFQGREKDIIILTTVANEICANDFVDNPNLINVAVSRAVDELIVVVSDGCDEWKGTNINDLVKYIQYNNLEVIESQIYSVFDLLYKSYSKKLLEVIKNTKKVSKYDSENLLNVIIEKVLSLPEFKDLNHIIHQPLKMLIKDPSKLNDEECKYTMNILTHTDFVIFNKFDKMPVLVVEVDGYAYHAKNPKQLERDKMKDNILEKYSIPILRLQTNGSGEERRLQEKLQDLLVKK
ncbi:superfamily I DNA and/or RNA helicase [Natranaerovirga pectinivora]|uniref:Superfamily I DNA and/or RNA helicase n=1 Tax=Natranaerovirga pectinivora TaxID=682400 RepID=A0A4R3MLH9_9FIRM|nr:AAA domain-containing protein [Natranaerovirga pectinivora]TCT15498.1 superfamily I DNA and/or RNA helicase [Natranaerovirga pectinivora]